MRVRLDQRLVELGLAPTRSRAALLIRAGEVRLAGRVADKPGTLVESAALPELKERPRFVSRGGDKLDAALDEFGLDVRGLRCIDAGASTGGFTHCLLERGARSVRAVDVGYGQLDARLRDDPRVEVRERTNVRHHTLEPGAAPFELLVADLSFISLVKLLPALLALVAPGAPLVLLVKPQFELERAEVGKGGVVRDPEARREAARRVREAAEARGARVRGEVESALAGPKGNRERFVWLEAP